MKRSFSRRDFLKVAGVGLGAMAFRPFKLDTLLSRNFIPQNDCLNFQTVKLLAALWITTMLEAAQPMTRIEYSHWRLACGYIVFHGRVR